MWFQPEGFLSDALVPTGKKLILKIAESFVRVFNGKRVQRNIQDKIDTANARIRGVCRKALAGEYRNVFGILQGIREIVDGMKSIETAWKIYELVCSSDLLGLLKDEHFQFFQDESKKIDDHVNSFIKLVDEHTQGRNDNINLDDKFELYLEEWKTNRKAWVPEVELEETGRADERRISKKEGWKLKISRFWNHKIVSHCEN